MLNKYCVVKLLTKFIIYFGFCRILNSELKFIRNLEKFVFHHYFSLVNVNVPFLPILFTGGCCIPRSQKYKAVAGKWKCLWTWAGLSKVDRYFVVILKIISFFRVLRGAQAQNYACSFALQAL